MDNEMIERCCEAYSGCKLSEWHPNVQQQIKETVVNIIKAMREPTEKMKQAGCADPITHSWGSEGEFTDADSAGNIWQSMIDAIIND